MEKWRRSPAERPQTKTDSAPATLLFARRQPQSEWCPFELLGNRPAPTPGSRERPGRTCPSSERCYQGGSAFDWLIAPGPIDPPCLASSTVACFVHPASECRIARIAAPPIPVQLPRAARPSRRVSPVTWCGARAPCPQGTNRCFSPVRSPAQNRDWLWLRTPETSLQVHSRPLAGRPKFPTSLR